MREALEQARAGRVHILDEMAKTLSASRNTVSSNAPRIITIKIPVDKIRDVIGPGGKMIRSIIERTGVKIDVEDDGRVNVASVDEASAQKAIGIIQELTATPELNKTYMTSTMPCRQSCCTPKLSSRASTASVPRVASSCRRFSMPSKTSPRRSGACVSSIEAANRRSHSKPSI